MAEDIIQATNQNPRRSEILNELETLSRLLDDLSVQMRADQLMMRDNAMTIAQAA